MSVSRCPLCARSGHSALQCRTSLFDHPVGATEQRQRQIEAKRLGRLEIDREVKLGRLHDRQVARRFALENPSGITARLMIGVAPRDGNGRGLSGAAFLGRDSGSLAIFAAIRRGSTWPLT